MRVVKFILGLVAISQFSACATIVGNPNHVLPISSTPSGANIKVIDETGKNVFEGKTPTTVNLPKSDGSYWGGKSYEVTLSRDGFNPKTIPVKTNPNFWYIGGNFVFGGLIGWFIVDPLNGGMYDMYPSAVEAVFDNTSFSIENPINVITNLAEKSGCKVNG
jgi:hypothetical protein